MALESYKMVLTFSWFKKQNHNNSKEEYMTDTTCGLQRLKVFIIQPLLKKKKRLPTSEYADCDVIAFFKIMAELQL